LPIADGVETRVDTWQLTGSYLEDTWQIPGKKPNSGASTPVLLRAC